MAVGAQQIGWGVRAGVVVAATVPVLILGTGAAILTAAETGRGLSTADWAAIRFTIVQATLSAVISTTLAIPLARALARRQFPGRSALVSLLGAPFLLPVIVAIFGLIAIFGQSGILNHLLVGLGAEPVRIYGLHGVVLAHVFFNLPLATRLILQGWADVPAERFQLAASLGMGAAAINRHIERAVLWRTAPGALLVIFVICTTSFAVALTLGGGPKATTVELAIYQAIRFDFDLSRAAILSVIQLILTGVVALIALRFAGLASFGAGYDRPAKRWDARSSTLIAQDAIVIALAALFLLTPIAAVLIRGAPELVSLPPQVWHAAITSVMVALCSTLLTLCAALATATASVHLRTRWVEVAALSAIAASPLVVGTGLFILTFPFVAPETIALPVTVLVNAVLTLPFALRALLPAMRSVEADYGRLSQSLGLTGWSRMRLVTLPRLRQPLGFSAGLAAALSMGDLGVIALFANQDVETLPLQIFRLMGAYQMEVAAGATTLLLVLSFGLFWLFDQWGRRHA